jgi:LmbE family N-acetylglucosaminyl deacetylase
MNRSILMVFAHPDDESFGISGTALLYINRGKPVDLICATRGEKGTRVEIGRNKDSENVSKEYYYLAKPRRYRKETDFFNPA